MAPSVFPEGVPEGVREGVKEGVKEGVDKSEGSQRGWIGRDEWEVMMCVMGSGVMEA